MEFNDRRSHRYKATQAGAEKVPVCRGCGEAFDSKETAHAQHGRLGCGTLDDGNRGYQMTKTSDAW